MKTPEDEAFDDLAKRQGAWGGGFTAKRQAAMDKINAEFREEYIKYRTAFPKEYAAPQPAQEPVAYLVLFEGAGKLLEFKKGNYIHGAKVEHIPLYTAPPQREWVGLTNAERHTCTRSPFPAENYRAIEAKLKEKNT